MNSLQIAEQAVKSLHQKCATDSLQQQVEDYCEWKGAVGGHYRAQTERDFYKQKCEKLIKENNELKAENEKYKHWASEVIYWSYTNNKNILEEKKLITKDDKPTFDNIRDFGKEIQALKADNEKLKEQINGDHWGVNKGLKQEKSDLIKQYKNAVKEIVELKEKIEEQAKEYDELKAKNKKQKEELIKTMLKSSEEIQAKLKAENEKLSMKYCVQSHLVDNLLAHRVKNADIDDGISISDEYGCKYIDSWNKEYDELIKEHIQTMNESELDGLKLVFYERDNIEFESVPETDDEVESDDE